MPEIMKLGAFGEASLSYDRKWPKLKDLSKMPLQSTIKLCGVCYKVDKSRQ